MPMILPPPAISIPPALPPPQRTVEILTFSAEVRCGSQPLARDGLVLPRPVVNMRYGPVAPPASAVYRYGFRIDGQGRVRTIRRDPAEAYPGAYVNTSDLAPSLAVSRFPAAARNDCSASYMARPTPIDAASPAELYALASLPDSGSVSEIWDRVRPADADCQRGPGQYRRLNLPAFEKLPQADAGASWVFLAYDVDVSGQTRGIRILGSSGNAALDRAGVRALADNRYAPGPGFRGCTYHFYREGRSTLLPVDLPPDAPADTGDQTGCVVDPKSIPGLLGGSAYPPAFSRRRVEGVAAVSYDTAPWGQVGNVKVLASEPDESFGETARSALLNARVAESDTGRRGCVQRVRFRLPPE